jgi:hypothetical protein
MRRWKLTSRRTNSWPSQRLQLLGDVHAMKTQTLLILCLSVLPARATLDTNRIAQVTALPGTWNAAEGVFKVTASRNDPPVSVDGWKMPPFMGLTTWAAFTEGKKAEAMIAGDIR